MAVKINGTTITMTRGDTLKVKVDMVTSDNQPYIPTIYEVVRFAMKKSYKDETLLIRKVLDNNSLILQLDPEDTEGLKQPSEYVYDIQITHTNGDVDTFISGKLRITEEVD